MPTNMIAFILVSSALTIISFLIMIKHNEKGIGKIYFIRNCINVCMVITTLIVNSLNPEVRLVAVEVLMFICFGITFQVIHSYFLSRIAYKERTDEQTKLIIKKFGHEFLMILFVLCLIIFFIFSTMWQNSPLNSDLLRSSTTFGLVVRLVL